MLCQSGGVLVSHCGGEMITLKINDSVSRERDAWEKLCYINYMTKFCKWLLTFLSNYNMQL